MSESDNGTRAMIGLRAMKKAWAEVAVAMVALAETIKDFDAADRSTLVDVPPGDDFTGQQQLALARMKRRVAWERVE